MRYPDDPAPQGNSSTPYPFEIARPLARGGPSWAQKTRALTRGDLFSTTLTYNALSWTQVKTLFDFWTAVGGGLGTFTFADFNGYVKGNSTGPGIAWKNLYVGKGDGATQAWTLPTFILQCHTTGGLIDNVTVKVAGVAKPNLTLNGDHSGTDGYIVQGGGTDGLDLLHLASAPVSSAIITIDGSCRRAIRLARFAADSFPFQTRNPANYQSGSIQIIEQVA
jgi:hypothetical protein